MGKRSGAVHVTTHRRHYTGKDGRERVYETHLLRRSWREDGKVRNTTVANLSSLPPETVELVRRSLAGERFPPAPAGAGFPPASGGARVARSLPHGHAAAVHVLARGLGFPALLGPPGRARDLAYALVISRVIRPASTVSTATWWGDVTLGPDLGVAGAPAAEVGAAMEWLVSRQDLIKRRLAGRRPRDGDGALSWCCRGGEQGHALIRGLARYLTWHLREAWSPLNRAGEQPARGVRDIVDHLGTLTRNELRYSGVVVAALAEPTPGQRRAFDLLGAAIPLTLS